MRYSPLKSSMTILLEKSCRNIGVVQKVSLNRGLGIEMYIDANHYLHLMLWRGEVAPSDLEWKAVLMCLSGYAPDPSPEPVLKTSIRRQALTAMWRLPRPDPFNQERTQQHEQE